MPLAPPCADPNRPGWPRRVHTGARPLLPWGERSSPGPAGTPRSRHHGRRHCALSSVCLKTCIPPAHGGTSAGLSPSCTDPRGPCIPIPLPSPSWTFSVRHQDLALCSGPATLVLRATARALDGRLQAPSPPHILLFQGIRVAKADTCLEGGMSHVLRIYLGDRNAGRCGTVCPA